MKQVFYGRIPIENATALLYFQKKGSVQRLLHNLKYRGQKQIGAFLGSWLGAELAEIPEYRDIGMVIPVPLHRRKQKLRGYNQVSDFGREIAKSLNAEYRADILLKTSRTRSQVFQKRSKRFKSEKLFNVTNPEPLQQKHILLVDDIVTTGATLENCATELLANSNVRLSVATMAMA
ncbi:ComF family protein [Aureitalea sp. L0-47]|uniref:ComF family protein n=1 Tax=Aureitalea sp. L0-47 TaxID=2816962 RepID=UPI002AA2A637|nr:phosphoribosyltransferase family protein [Aureitalea sp. L0-47]